MRKLIGAAAVLAIALPAFAQTTPPGPPAATVPGPIGQAQTGTAPTTPGTPAPGTMGSSAATNPTVPGSVLKPATPDPVASTAPIVPKAVPGAPVAGANSFTESQAKARIEANGFANVTGLKKDDQSVWRGTATKDGKQVSVALDYQGNVVAQ